MLQLQFCLFGVVVVHVACASVHTRRVVFPQSMSMARENGKVQLTVSESQFDYLCIFLRRTPSEQLGLFHGKETPATLRATKKTAPTKESSVSALFKNQCSISWILSLLHDFFQDQEIEISGIVQKETPKSALSKEERKDLSMFLLGDRGENCDDIKISEKQFWSFGAATIHQCQTGGQFLNVYKLPKP